MTELIFRVNRVFIGKGNLLCVRHTVMKQVCGMLKLETILTLKLKRKSQLQQKTNFTTSFLVFEKK